MPAIKLRDDGRIQRLVSLAYILSTRTEIHIEELCERLEISKEQLETDLNVLMFCGLPPYSPEQLFDISIDDEFVSMYFNDVFVSPLRLKNSEVVQILIALERLKSNSVNPKERELVIQTISKINRSQKSPIEVELGQTDHFESIQEALKKSCDLEITYLSLNSAKIDDRQVSPKAIYNSASTSYLFAVDRKSSSERLFRIDRILSAKVSTKSSKGVIQESLPTQFDSNNQQVFIEESNSYVDLSINEQASWILDSIPSESVDESNNIHRFFTASPYFVARLLLSNYPNVNYQGGTITKDAVKRAVEAVQAQMRATTLDCNG